MTTIVVPLSAFLRFILVSHFKALRATGVGMNLSPFVSKLIWSFVSSLFERFFYVFFVCDYCDS